MAKTYIVDGNSLLFRCFYATFRPDTPVMSASDGTPTNAIYAFSTMIHSLREKLSGDDRMVVCFDTGKPSFRSEEIDHYKTQRKPTEPELKTQIPLAHEMLRLMGIFTAEMEGYEGDDVAGSLAKTASGHGDDVLLFTSDKDFLQLVGPRVSVECLRKGLTDTLTYTQSNIRELYGVRADQVADFKAIAGDASDNYKGIPGIGEKTAVSLLSQYDHLEDILEAYRGKDDTAVARKLNAGADEGRLCLKIATIVTDLDVEEIYESSRVRDPDLDALLQFYLRYDLRKAADRVRKEIARKERKAERAQPILPAQSGGYRTVQDIDTSRLPSSVSAVLDGENENTAEVLGFILGYRDRTPEFLPLKSAQSSAAFRQWFEDGSAKKGCLDSKSTIVSSRRFGFDPEGFDFDFLLTSYIVDSDRADTLKKAMEQLYIELPDDPVAASVTATDAMEKNREHLLSTVEERDSLKLLTDVELPLAANLADMETEGLPIDLGELSSIGEQYRAMLSDLSEQIYALAGTEFNIKSPQQVADILFHRLGLTLEKGESGTSVEVLNNHCEDHPIVPLILRYRTYSKILSGYVESLPKHVLADGRIHARINQTLTSTGRLSCSEPNLQNISIRKEEGKEIRKAFLYPDDEYEFLSLDYSQVELRMLAELGNIPNLVKVCNSGSDIHTATASIVYGVPEDQVTPEMRRVAKTVNFGIVYGISTFGLKKRLGVSFREADQIISAFKKTFDGLEEYENRTKEFARENGYVCTILNRRRYFPDINSPDRRARSFSERAAVNAVIQGSAADLIKVAMNRVADLLRGRRTRMIVQIHDELVFKVHRDEREELIPQIVDAMENAMDLRVKQTVEGSAGRSWYDCK